MMPSPVIAIDGPSSSGKGTVSLILARRLGWHFLDSGALYRLVALAAVNHAIPLDQAATLETLAGHLDVQFEADADLNVRIVLEGEDVTDTLRTEECGNGASKVAVLAGVRRALLDRQRTFREPPGLVADGRDMGSVVFPDAALKVFLTASCEERGRRRYNQLKEKGLNVSLSALIQELAERDARDSARAVAPLVVAPGAVVLDSTALSVAQVVDRLAALWDNTRSEHRQG